MNMKGKSMTIDNELLKGINLMKSGDEAGFNMVYSKTYNFVYAKARFIMKNEQDALDLTQETYVQAYKGIASLHDATNIYAWLGAIVYNQGMRIFRKKKEILLDEGAEGIFDDIVSEDTDTRPEVAAEAKATADIVKGFIEELPELQKVAVLAFYYDNMKIDDIATICDCSSNTIKSRLNYAKKFLKDKVEEHEKQNHYKLHSFTPALFIIALKMLLDSDKYNMSVYAAEGVYGGVCSSIGMSAAGTSGIVGVAGASNVTTAMSAVTATATKVGLCIGVKIAVGAASLLLVTGITAGIIIAINSNPDTPSDNTTQPTASMVTQESTTPTEEPTDETLSWNEWNLTEGTYTHSYVTTVTYNSFGNITTMDKTFLTEVDISNLRYDSPKGPITVDITLSYYSYSPGADYQLHDVVMLTDAVIENGQLNVTEISYDMEEKWMMNFTLQRDGSILFSAEIEKKNGTIQTFNDKCPTTTTLVKNS